ncbi:MAG: cbb3-type cytochrome c oxidase subunit I, partial [Nitriliruptorales bacterium]
GGITGVMVAAVPFDLQAHDSYFVVAHLHYVLIGGVVFPIFAGIYYWFPKFTGRLLDERLGRWNFWLLFVGVNVAFFPMHQVGLLGMPRRVYTYEAGLGWDIYNLISTIGVLIIVPGIAVFLWNVARSYRRGEEAGANPWDADSLEWAVPSPPAQHGWTVLPIVRSRHPLWDQNELDRGDERLERFVHGIGQWPLKWRAAVIVGTADARPQEVFRVAGPSMWPLVAALGVVLIFLSELVKLRLGAALGALVIVAAAIGWNWPQQPPMSVEEEDDFEREYGVPVNAHGSVVVARWGTALAILFIAIAFASLLLSYFYLRLENPLWPPAGVSNPPLGQALPAAALMVASAGGVRTAQKRIGVGDRRGFILGLVAALALAGSGAVVQWLDIAQLGMAARDHAYGSIFYTLAGFVSVVTVGAMIMLAMVVYWATQGTYSVRRHAPVANVVRFWLAMVVVWVVGFGTLYLGPYLT